MEVFGLDTAKNFVVKSDSNPSVFYTIKFEDNEWKCDCPAFTYRKDLTKPCKHITKLIDEYSK